jgi:excisionase family DNA binding protein
LARLITVATVASMARVSTRTVYAWASTGALPSIRLGARTIRFDPKAVQAYLESRSTEGVSA